MAVMGQEFADRLVASWIIPDAGVEGDGTVAADPDGQEGADAGGAAETGDGRELTPATVHIIPGCEGWLTGMDPEGTTVAAWRGTGVAWWTHDGESWRLEGTTADGKETLAARCIAVGAGKIAIGIEDGRVLTVDTGSGTVTGPVAVHKGPVTALGLAGSGMAVLTAGRDGFVRRLEPAQLAVTHAAGLGEPVGSLAVSGSGSTVAVHGEDGRVTLLSGRDLTKLWQVEGAGAKGVAVSGDDRRCALVRENCVQIWDTAKRVMEREVPVDGRVSGMGWLPGHGDLLAIQSDGRVIRVGISGLGRVECVDLVDVPTGAVCIARSDKGVSVLQGHRVVSITLP